MRGPVARRGQLPCLGVALYLQRRWRLQGLSTQTGLWCKLPACFAHTFKVPSFFDPDCPWVVHVRFQSLLWPGALNVLQALNQICTCCFHAAPVVHCLPTCPPAHLPACLLSLQCAKRSNVQTLALVTDTPPGTKGRSMQRVLHSGQARAQ